MYIEKYWGDYIGGTDDSLTLTDYLKEKQREEISLGEIFSDTGLAGLHGNFREHEEPLVFQNSEGWEMEFYFAIDLITDLASLLLECKVNGSVCLYELAGEDEEEADAAAGRICITATPDEHELIDQALKDFVAAPLAYDLSEMMPEEEMLEMAAVCEKLRKELYGASAE